MSPVRTVITCDICGEPATPVGLSLRAYWEARSDGSPMHAVMYLDLAASAASPLVLCPAHAVRKAADDYLRTLPEAHRDDP